MLKRCVLSFDLKVSSEDEFRTSKGSVFQSLGAAHINALSPSVTFVLCVVVCSSRVSCELRRLCVCFCVLGSKSSMIWLGAWPMRALYTIINILKEILWRTGSQCNSLKRGVIRENLELPQISLAHVFCTSCRDTCSHASTTKCNKC